MKQAGEHIELAGPDTREDRNPLIAHAAFFEETLATANAALDDAQTASLTIILPPASSEHDAWRRALAADLARAHTPKRVNIAAGTKGDALNTLRAYLRDAPGVTGHYVQAHD